MTPWTQGDEKVLEYIIADLKAAKDDRSYPNRICRLILAYIQFTQLIGDLLGRTL